MIDVLVIGGGPAGMGAALVAGRGRMEVVLIDDEKPRNAVTQESHAFLTRDGITPEDFRLAGRSDLLKYPNISVKPGRVKSIERKEDETFEVTTDAGEFIRTKNIVLATGLSETLPKVEDIEKYYGRSLFSCPFCDGWEMKEQPLVLIAETSQALHVVQLLTNWTDDLVVATNGLVVFDSEQKALLEGNNIRLIEDTIRELKGSDGQLESVHFEGGEILERTGGFITTELKHPMPFIEQLDLEVSEAGFVVTNMMGQTNIPGIYAAGEITGPSQLIVSASQGHMAGIGIIAQASQANFNRI
ncbi:NAD(P)/FAD-dependent oxidoreductase [Ruoffia tabacinasalis]|uniref:NAD(P)/FAD-dependent oxidoreductase n=1 Tax=Ruoffia tabacinasalis TaxID=87458 RepID=A0ABS0LG30_9LACT|nr:NAD(P)/FAD-dependent oxidoreductase [Ruoffia tabacinasalis]MBG9977166.1 NAD(P)/FAD-dependent oxidoreductase [Ruoffia tabacinasalis]